MDLSQVSRTAILLLICRAVETGGHGSVFNDPMAVLCLERLLSMASEEDRRWIIRKKRENMKEYEHAMQNLAYGD